VRAPLLDGIFGQPVAIQKPPSGIPQDQLAAALEKVPAETVIADARYIHDSIVLPEQEVAAGYKPIMPTFKNRLTEEQIFQIITYIRSLGVRRPYPGSGMETRTRDLSADEYRARVGFVPENIKGLGGTPAPAGNGRQ